MGKLFLQYLPCSNIYICKICKCHLSSKSDLISKDFWAGSGKAYLYQKVINYLKGHPEERILRTGQHIVCDVFCKVCANKVGWTYEWAQDPEQKYKEGKVILERNLIDKTDWE